MSNAIILDLAFGDSGKGKIVDCLAWAFNVVVRFQGGPNAGHTIISPAGEIALHQIPSGITHTHILNIIGNGCVLNLEKLFKEIEGLRTLGFDISPRNLLVSDRAHVINSNHIQADKVSGQEVGTTGQGIGPCYRDKADRIGTRTGDLVRLETLRPFLCDCTEILHRESLAGKRLLFEGAQGTFLDIDHGTYPYVTSSNTTIGAAYTGSGIFLPIDRRIGVVKAYTTRVGNGPFPTEMLGEEKGIADRLREKGREYGATTGRPRRIGWLDLTPTKRACIINGINEIALTRLDILSGMERIKVSITQDGNQKYYALPGWQDEVRGAAVFGDLPLNCQRYIWFIEDQLGIPATIISTGPATSETILRLR
jgi:adenylosuccinate synthase